MVTRRGLLQASAAAAVGVLLAACGQAASPTQQAPTAQPAQAPAAAPAAGATNTPAPAAAAQPSGATTTGSVKFWWHHGGDIGKAVEAANAEFQKRNPGIKIEGLQVSDLGTKVNTALAGGAGPDVWDSDMGTLQYAAKGAIRELDQYLPGSAVKVDDYPQKPAMVWKGKVYAIPAIESGMENGLLWSKKLFREAGLDPEKPPKTWDELMAASAKLTKADASGNVLQLGFNDRDSSAGMFPNLLTTEGFAFYEQETQKISFTQPEAVDLVERVVAHEKKLDPAKVGAFTKTYPTWGSVTPGGAFSTEKEAMMIDGSWAPGGLAQLAPNIEVGYTWTPSKSGNVKTQQMGAHQLATNSQAKAPEAAWKLIEYFAAAGNQLIYDMSGSFAYTKPFAAKVDTSKWKGLDWYFKSVDQASFVRPRGYCPVGPDAWKKWWAAVDDLVFGRVSSAKDALAKAEQESQALLDQMLKS
jgi:multiple sugar transport system substrate-binding protein